MKEAWAIRNVSNHEEYWNNNYGWVDVGEDSFKGFMFTIFTKEEKEEINLPIEGEWVNYVMGKMKLWA